MRPPVDFYRNKNARPSTAIAVNMSLQHGVTRKEQGALSIFAEPSKKQTALTHFGMLIGTVFPGLVYLVWLHLEPIIQRVASTLGRRRI
jgi:hypothetical protein